MKIETSNKKVLILGGKNELVALYTCVVKLPRPIPMNVLK